MKETWTGDIHALVERVKHLLDTGRILELSAERSVFPIYDGGTLVAMEPGEIKIEIRVIEREDKHD